MIAEFPPNGDARHLFLKLEDQPARELGQPASLARPTILLCHEDLTLLQLFTEIFDDASYHVLAQQDGDPVYPLIKSAKPDLVVLDLRMRGVRAGQVVNAVRADAATASIPVLVCVTTRGEIDAGWVQESGCELLLMPFDIDNLLETAQRLTRQPSPIARTAFPHPAMA